MKALHLLLTHTAGTGAALAVIDNPTKGQVVARLIPFRDEHVTIHRTHDGSLLKTHWWRDKPEGTWDNARVDAATAEGYEKPGKHSAYTVHEPVREQYLWDFGDHVISRLIDVGDLSTKSKYMTNAVTAAAPKQQFPLEIYFSRERQDVNGDPRLLWELETSLGWLYIVHG